MLISTPDALQPTYRGFIETERDALLLLDACLLGALHHLPRRPYQYELSVLIRSGSVFIYEENASGILEWTDGAHWIPVGKEGDFCVDREPDNSTGLFKKTITINVRGILHHLVSYYTAWEALGEHSKTPTQDIHLQLAMLQAQLDFKLLSFTPSNWLAFERNALFLCINLVGDPDSDLYQSLLRQGHGDWCPRHWTDEGFRHAVELAASIWDENAVYLESQMIQLLLRFCQLSLGRMNSPPRSSQQPSGDFTALQNTILVGIAFGVSTASPKGIGTIDPGRLSEDLVQSNIFPEGEAMNPQDVLEWSVDLGAFLRLTVPKQDLELSLPMRELFTQLSVDEEGYIGTFMFVFRLLR
ncbi:MAG: hypothetical protein M1833_003442 [Piccolia ochrophora]|nr:MAG: hypothetical protein M1833_003442 [Piccolia ochrophora]